MFYCRRLTSLQQTRLVSQDADRSRRSQCAPIQLIVTSSAVSENSKRFTNHVRGASLCARCLLALDTTPRELRQAEWRCCWCLATRPFRALQVPQYILYFSYEVRVVFHENHLSTLAAEARLLVQNSWSEDFSLEGFWLEGTTQESRSP